MNIIKGQRFYNTTYNEYNTIVLYSVLYTYNRTIEASLMPFQTYCYQAGNGGAAALAAVAACTNCGFREVARRDRIVRAYSKLDTHARTRTYA